MTRHVVYVPKGSRIENIRSNETGCKGVRSQEGSWRTYRNWIHLTGLEKGHKHLIVIGFDGETEMDNW